MNDICEAPTVLIPAAGFGTRVGSPPAKELLLRPNSGEPLIQAPLMWAQERHWNAVVITRRDKQLLIDFLTLQFPMVKLCLVDSTPDWTTTMSLSHAYWTNKNILILPDVEFSPVDVLDQINIGLDDHDVMVGSHSVSDCQNWGFLRKISAHLFEVSEKPNKALRAEERAWGVLGFRGSIGHSLFESQRQSQREDSPKVLEGRLGECPLDHFRDLTRDTSILSTEVLL